MTKTMSSGRNSALEVVASDAVKNHVVGTQLEHASSLTHEFKARLLRYAVSSKACFAMPRGGNFSEVLENLHTRFVFVRKASSVSLTF